MRKLLKVLSAAMLSAIVAVSAASAVSAAGLNSAEETVMAELTCGLTLENGETLYLTQARINEAENYLLNGVDLSDAQADAIIARINEGKEYIVGTGVSSLSELSEDQIMQLAAIAQKASDDAGLGSRVAGIPEPSIDQTADKNPIKTTGFGIPSVAAIAGAGILMVSAAGVCLARSSKKNSVCA